MMKGDHSRGALQILVGDGYCATNLPTYNTDQDTTLKLYGRYYCAHSPRPVSKWIYSQANSSGRFPRLDLLLSGHRLQSYIHDAVVTVVFRRVATRFHIFFKNHCRLPNNEIVHNWNLGAHWRGDIFVMRKGRSKELVNFCKGDALLADFVIQRFIGRVKQKRRLYVPKKLVFFKA